MRARWRLPARPASVVLVARHVVGRLVDHHPEQVEARGCRWLSSISRFVLFPLPTTRSTQYTRGSTAMTSSTAVIGGRSSTMMRSGYWSRRPLMIFAIFSDARISAAPATLLWVGRTRNFGMPAWTMTSRSFAAPSSTSFSESPRGNPR